ncbi:hypothetical protein JZ751_003602 [Albula glossodonta]|uniref:Uncharacterized protein n=1 Tax=Albula glossodonta TaxID=121402 RepID=A0A8T2NHD4_9TELE|nr:hypothetical protein JZ751_003602 [Albula glossodonta]
MWSSGPGAQCPIARRSQESSPSSSSCVLTAALFAPESTSVISTSSPPSTTAPFTSEAIGGNSSISAASAQDSTFTSARSETVELSSTLPFFLSLDNPLSLLNLRVRPALPLSSDRPNLSKEQDRAVEALVPS